MKKRANSLLCLVVILLAGACAGNTVPKPLVLEEIPDFATYLATQRDQPISRKKQDSKNKSEVRKMTTDIFMPFWTIDYGFRLNPENDRDTIITPEFANTEVSDTFELFFLDSNLALYEGKKIYCECVGEHYMESGQRFYKIYKARLYGK